MKQSVNFDDFERAFKTMGREKNFDYAGLTILFDYLKEYEEDTGEEIELDVIALCCDYAQGTTAEIAEEYDIDMPDNIDDDEKKRIVLKYLDDKTTVCGSDDETIVFQQF